MSPQFFKSKSAHSGENYIAASVRVDRRTKNLTKRLQKGEIAVIDHCDLDTVAAEALVAIKPIAVVNASKSISGRYPNMGPKILLQAGIPILDNVGSSVMSLKEGQRISLNKSGEIYVAGEILSEGQWLDEELVEQMMQEANAGMVIQLKRFAANTMDYVEREAELIFDGAGVPKLRTKLEGRHVIVVVRGYDFTNDIRILKPYIKEYHPLIMAVDGGADAVIAAGYKPDIIIGDMDSVSDEALCSGAEIVVHGYRDGSAPGSARVEELGVEHVVFPFTGTSEDIALILADEKGANLIVTVGSHTSIAEFLDKGRDGMASTFITRIRVGGKLVDAKGVSRLYRTRISNWQLFLLILAGIFAVFVAIATTAAGQTIFGLFGVWWDSFIAWVLKIF